jgi:hypothetical protein
MYKYACLILLFLGTQGNLLAQTVSVLDNSFETAGVSKVLAFDVNNDGLNELVSATTGTLGRIGYYLNESNNSFSNFNLIETAPFTKGIAVGDFNNDDWNDIVSIGGSNFDSKIHLNDHGIFSQGILIDSNNPSQLNDVVVADFDQDNFDDIVIIGQHSIDFYRNGGDGSFSKEIILSTSTSPLQLECLDLEVKDLDNDGDMDLVCGETAGLVVYLNDGNGVFTPNYYSILPEVIFVIHVVDLDNDGDMDVVCKNGANDLKWFSNDGNGVLTYEATISTSTNFISFKSIDFNNDGLQDLFVSYTNNISVYLNDDMHSFDEEISIYQNSNLLMGIVEVAELNNIPGTDLVWSGGTNGLFYQIMPQPLTLSKLEEFQLSIFPNPTAGKISFNSTIDRISVYNLFGMRITEEFYVDSLDLSNCLAGCYLVFTETDGKSAIHKVIKY